MKAAPDEPLGFTLVRGRILTDVEHHDPFVATSNHEDLYACIDLVVDRSIRQLSDHKSRIRDNKHPNGVGENSA